MKLVLRGGNIKAELNNGVLTAKNIIEHSFSENTGELILDGTNTHGSNGGSASLDDYTGWPFVTDDFYRGFLGSQITFGLDDAIKAKIGYGSPQLYKGPSLKHHPTFDAYEICSLFASFLDFQNPEETPAIDDDSGLPEEDVKLVMDRANAERIDAIVALKAADDDIVKAIMALT